MGISGLLPFLKQHTKKTHLSQFEGQRVAIDGYSWLHKGAYCCSSDLCLNRPTDKYVTYFLKRIQTLLNHGLQPLVVFDGGNLPMKKDENESRRNAKRQNFEKGKALLAQGKPRAAEEFFQRAVNISPRHAKNVIEALKRKGIEFIVAPYEADSQMAFLAQNGKVDLVMTEDSDLLAYGCPEVLFKLGRDGYVEQVSMGEVMRSSTFTGFTRTMFTEMCIFAGCDFLANVPNVGMKKAYDFMRKLRRHESVIKRLKYSSYKVPETYKEDFKRALMVFQHQTVYDPTSRSLRHLSPIPPKGAEEEPEQGGAGREVRSSFDSGSVEATPTAGTSESLDLEDLDFLGPHHSNTLARMIAEGDVHPSTFKRFEPLQQEPHFARRSSPRIKGKRENAKPSGFRAVQPHSMKRMGDYYLTTTSVSASKGALQDFIPPRLAGREGIAKRLSLDVMMNKKEKVIGSKYFQSATNNEGGGDASLKRKSVSLPPAQSQANQGNYLRKTVIEAKRAVSHASMDFGKYTLKEAPSGAGAARTKEELLSPPRKMHKVMKSDVVCSQQFQPPTASHQPVRRSPRKKKNIFARTNPGVVGLKFAQYRFTK
ncbi:XPG/Rad2 endonuclease [Chloropicon primus]|nr:XPG/Rad2 endonuclease [Chloropicon primus]